ncbi:MAG: hypothetical protein ACTSUR_02055 [Candidatus Heimdallarchaeaceae archaeon]
MNKWPHNMFKIETTFAICRIETFFLIALDLKRGFSSLNITTDKSIAFLSCILPNFDHSNQLLLEGFLVLLSLQLSNYSLCYS